MDFGLACEDVGSDAQSQFDQFYNVAYQLLDAFYPECTITVTSRDPSYMKMWKCGREMWACVRRLTGKQKNVGRVEGITAETLNDQYCTISTDSQYIAPAVKHTVQASGPGYITE